MTQSSLNSFLSNTTLGRDIRALASELAHHGVSSVLADPNFPCNLTVLFYGKRCTMVATAQDYEKAILELMAEHFFKGDLVKINAAYVGIKANRLSRQYNPLVHILYKMQQRDYLTCKDKLITPWYSRAHIRTL